MFGCELSDHQLYALLRTRATRIYVGIDPEEETRIDLRTNKPAKLISETCKKLISCEKLILRFDEVFIIIPPKGKADFGDCTVDECYEAMKNAKPFEYSRFEEMEEKLWNKLKNRGAI